jgi:hydrogenase nickel incorporation protein HypA/HybF
MHEFSLVKSILSKALEVSRDHGELPVTCVTVEVGQLRQVVPELLHFAFQAAAAETAAANATLQLEQVGLEIACDRCAVRYSSADVLWTCPLCGCTNGEIVHGDELILKSIELADWLE